MVPFFARLRAENSAQSPATQPATIYGHLLFKGCVGMGFDPEPSSQIISLTIQAIHVGLKDSIKSMQGQAPPLNYLAWYLGPLNIQGKSNMIQKFG